MRIAAAKQFVARYDYDRERWTVVCAAIPKGSRRPAKVWVDKARDRWYVEEKFTHQFLEAFNTASLHGRGLLQYPNTAGGIVRLSGDIT